MCPVWRHAFADVLSGSVELLGECTMDVVVVEYLQDYSVVAVLFRKGLVDALVLTCLVTC